MLRGERWKVASIVALFGSWGEAQADVVWPALLISFRFFDPKVILGGLLVEFLVITLAFRLSLARASLVTIAMNGVSALLGLVVIPVVGVAYELGPGELINSHLGLGTFNPVGWTATYILAVLCNTAIEAGVIRYGFRLDIMWARVSWLTAANAVSVGLAFMSFWLAPSWG